MKKQSVLILLTLLTLTILNACGNSQTANSGTVSNNGTSTNTQTESEVLEDEKDKSIELSWIPLAELTTYQDTLRVPFEEAFNIKLNNETGEKEGHLYRDKDGFTVQNNTLYGVLLNTQAKQLFGKDKTKEALINAASNTYIDLVDADEDSKFYMAINGYFNLLPDRDETHCEFSTTLSRAEFMAMLMRAETPVDNDLELDANFNATVGATEFNLYAQAVADHAYINTSDKSLNATTYNDKITRAEAIYLLMNHYYGAGLEIQEDNEIVNLDLSTVETTFTDAKDGGDITKAQGYTDKDNASAYTLQYALNNTTTGLPTDLYKAIVLAEQYGLIDASEETRWDESLTKSEAIELTYKAIYAATADELGREWEEQAEAQKEHIENTENNTGLTDEEMAGIPEDILNDPMINIISGSDKKQGYYYDEFGNFDQGLEEAGLTQAEDDADGWPGFQCHYDEDGRPYITHNKSGDRYELGDWLPDGSRYTGHDAKSAEMWRQIQIGRLDEALEDAGITDEEWNSWMEKWGN